MQQSKIWLSSPHMGGNEMTYIKEAFENNWIAPLGPNVSGFEQDLENYLSPSTSEDYNKIHVAALSSGTAALHLSLIMAGVERGDEVLCQSFTFAASANPILYLGATPVFIDSEKDTYNLSPYFLEEAIKNRILKGKKPKAIIAVHLYGMPFKVDEILQIAHKYEIPLIEDSAEALGSTYKGRKCGTFGDFGILSFNGNKIITTSGGGALVSKKLHCKEKAIFLATQARENAAHYQHNEIGYNYRLSNISAGIGRGQMEILDEHVALRRKMNEFYQNLFISVEEINVFSEPESFYWSNHWLSVVNVNAKKMSPNKEKLRLHLENKNIESRPLWKPMHLQPIFKDAMFFGNGVAEELFDNGLCLPSGSNLNDKDRDRIKEAIKEFLSNP